MSIEQAMNEVQSRLNNGATISEALAIPTTVGLNLAVLRAANLERCNTSFHRGSINEWSPSDWACAMAGEAGEVCNDVKKLRRIAADPESVISDDGTDYADRVAKVADEIADVLIYADLLAARLGINLSEAVRRKFNIVSVRVGSNQRL